MLDSILKDLLTDVAIEINSDENFTDDFKKFTMNATVICKLCKIFEDGTGNKITIDNVMDEKGVFNFIKATLPIIQKLGLNIKINNKMLKAVIKDFYLKIEETGEINENF